MDTDHDSGGAGCEAAYAWAGPALFTTVLCAVIAFFWWFLS